MEDLPPLQGPMKSTNGLENISGSVGREWKEEERSIKVDAIKEMWYNVYLQSVCYWDLCTCRAFLKVESRCRRASSSLSRRRRKISVWHVPFLHSPRLISTIGWCDRAVEDFPGLVSLESNPPRGSVLPRSQLFLTRDYYKSVNDRTVTLVNEFKKQSFKISDRADI